jgi:hypothetical protein
MPIYHHLCHQKSNLSRETVPLTSFCLLDTDYILRHIDHNNFYIGQAASSENIHRHKLL